ncbi:WD40 repeat domain-containing protein, partial [Planctomycetota bacterium]
LDSNISFYNKGYKVTVLGDPRFNHGGQISLLHALSDGKTIVSCGAGTAMGGNTCQRFWDLKSGKELRSYRPTYRWQTQNISLKVEAISPDGNRLVGRKANHKCIVYDRMLNKEIIQLDKHIVFGQNSGQFHKFSTDGKQLYWITSIKNPNHRGIMAHVSALGIWEECCDIRLLPIDIKHSLTATALSVDGGYLATNTCQYKKDIKDNTIQIWKIGADAVTAEHSFDSGMDWIQSLSFSPDGLTLLVSGSSRRAKGNTKVLTQGEIYDFPSCILKRRLTFTGVFHEAVFSRNGKYIYGHDNSKVGRIRIWDLKNNTEIFLSQQKIDSFFVTGAVSADGKMAAALDNKGRLSLISLDSGQIVKEMSVATPKHRDKSAVSLQLSHDAKVMVVTWNRKYLFVWNLETANKLCDITPSNGLNPFGANQKSYRLSKDGKTVFTLSTDGMINAWDSTSGKSQRSFNLFFLDPKDNRGFSSKMITHRFTIAENCKYGLLLRGIGKRQPNDSIISTYKLSLWDIEVGKQQWQQDETKLYTGVRQFLFSPSTKNVMMLFLRGSTVITWNCSDGKEIMRYNFDSSPYSPKAMTMAFSPDNKNIICALNNGEIEFRNLTTGKVTKHLSNILFGDKQTSRIGHNARFLQSSIKAKAFIAVQDNGTVCIYQQK